MEGNGNGMESGWTMVPWLGGVYRFERIDQDEAARLQDQRQRIYAVDTINTADAENGQVCRNSYYTAGLARALTLAAHLEADLADVAEEVVAIRLVTEEEAEFFWAAEEYFHQQLPPAISDDDVAALIRERVTA